ncbi:TPA: hypothetical protein L8N98_005282, partial [Klebsiella quasipneumoniae subsp. similipneumoniae]|nr:hypothetical protein [Klebsiella quasipneumoniae subsp. similipneumoniae]
MSKQRVAAPDVAVAVYALKAELERLAVTEDLHSDYQLAREALRRSGLLALRVPQAAGGWGGSQAQAIAVNRILAQADAGIAQLLQPHYGFTDTIPLLPSVDAQQVLYQDVL